MNNNKIVQKSETLFVGMVLAMTAGVLDAYTYLVRDGVFASLQTGNIIFTALALAQGNFADMGYYMASILCFASGVFVTECIRRKFFHSNRIHWRQIIICVEILVVCSTVFVPLGQYDILATCMIAFVCAMQIESFRKINGRPAFTTIMTGALRSATHMLYGALVEHDKVARRYFVQYVSIILGFVVGVIFCAFAVQWIGIYAVLISVVPLAVACIGMNVRRAHSVQQLSSDMTDNSHADSCNSDNACDSAEANTVIQQQAEGLTTVQEQ